MMNRLDLVVLYLFHLISHLHLYHVVTIDTQQVKQANQVKQQELHIKQQEQ
jgi:hypothetical protein